MACPLLNRFDMIDQLFAGGTYPAVKRMLDMAAQQHEALAGNIANVETPGYRRVDLDRAAVADFQSELRAAAQTGRFDAAPATGPMRTLLDPTAQASRADGNNVEIDQELLAMSRNTVEYGALTEFASNSLKCLKMAITGQAT